MEFVASDLDAPRAVPANAEVLAALERDAGPDAGRRAGCPPWIVGGFVIDTHPDLVIRTAELATAAGASFRFAFGRPLVVATAGSIVAIGIGVFDMAIRCATPPGPTAAGIAGHPRPGYGPDWWTVAAFDRDVPRADQLPRLVRLIGTAAGA